MDLIAGGIGGSPVFLGARRAPLQKWIADGSRGNSNRSMDLHELPHTIFFF
jgi:hypothetical protein